MTIHTGQQIITTHILANISRIKNNQAIKFDQLVKDNLRIIFLQKLCRILGRKISYRALFVFLKSFI